jgi:hypothetical protein
LANSRIIFLKEIIQRAPIESPRDSDDGKFIGEYYTTWHDEIGSHKSVLAKLIIKRKFENIFSLEWQPAQDTDKFHFWGEGIVCDGILIGDYRDFENR